MSRNEWKVHRDQPIQVRSARLPASSALHWGDPLVVLADGVEVCPAGSTEFAVAPHRPDVAKAVAVAVGVGVDVGVRLEVGDDLVDEAIDLALVRARDEVGVIRNTSELVDPDRLAKLSVVVNNLFHAIHVVLVNMDSSEVPRRLDLLRELSEPSLIGLFAHGRAAKLGASGLEGRHKFFPQTDTLVDAHASGAAARGTVRLLEAHHVRGVTAEAPEGGKTLSIGAVGGSATPEHGHSDRSSSGLRWVGGPVVPPTDLVLQVPVGITGGKTGLVAVGREARLRARVRGRVGRLGIFRGLWGLGGRLRRGRRGAGFGLRRGAARGGGGGARGRGRRSRGRSSRCGGRRLADAGGAAL